MGALGYLSDGCSGYLMCVMRVIGKAYLVQEQRHRKSDEVARQSQLL